MVHNERIHTCYPTLGTEGELWFLALVNAQLLPIALIVDRMCMDTHCVEVYNSLEVEYYSQTVLPGHNTSEAAGLSLD